MATATLSPPFVAIPPVRSRVVPITVDQYEFLIQKGKLAESANIELVNGQIVRKDRSHRGGDPMAIGEEHAWVGKRLGKLDRDLEGLGVSIQTQQPIVLPPGNMPEPDGAIVRGTEDDYLGRHPRSTDVLCVIEVADSSLDDDRTTKQSIYAAAGLTPYFIVNIPDRQIEWHEGPQSDGTYANVRVVHPGETIDLPLGGGRAITVQTDRLIPPTLA